MNLTKKAKAEFLKRMLGTNATWAVNGLLRIYERQTREEQNTESTREHNGVGFSAFDAEILTSFAKQYRERGFLSERQMAILFKKMPHYWGQLLSISDPAKLESAITKASLALAA